MSHARIEEVSDSDPEIDDPSDYLPSSDNQILRPAGQPSSSSRQEQNVNPTLFTPPPPSQQMRTQADVEQSRAAIKDYCMVYPCYFSSARTRAQGRRVSKELAIADPLAYNLLIALKEVIEPDRNRIYIAFEPDKTHPKDWANPGRARVQLFDKETHAPLHPTIKNKEHLFIKVAKWLKAHPTKKEDAIEMKIAGLPVPDKFLDTQIPIPKGWSTMNQILPLHSPAVSGGGVNDDFFKEALEEMKQVQGGGGGGGGGPGGMPDMASLQQMMQSMGGMGGMGGLGGLGGMGGMGLPGMGGGASTGGRKKDKKKG